MIQFKKSTIVDNLREWKIGPLWFRFDRRVGLFGCIATRRWVLTYHRLNFRFYRHTKNPGEN